MKIQHKGVTIDINGSMDEISTKGIKVIIPNPMTLTEFINVIGCVSSVGKESQTPPIDLSRNCKCHTDQFQIIVDKLQEEVSQTVEEFARRRKIEEKWNGKSGKECNLQVSYRGTNKWNNYTGDNHPTFNWDFLDYRVKEEVLNKSEYERRLNIERAWNGKFNKESNVEVTDWDNNIWVDKSVPPFYWNQCDYRVKEEKSPPFDTAKEVMDQFEKVTGMTWNESIRRMSIERAWNREVNGDSNVECRTMGDKKWYNKTTAKWDWDKCDYRMKQEEKVSDYGKVYVDTYNKITGWKPSICVLINKLGGSFIKHKQGNVVEFGNMIIIYCKDTKSTEEIINRVLAASTLFNKDQVVTMEFGEDTVTMKQAPTEVTIKYKRGE